MTFGPQPAPLRSLQTNLKLLLACCFTEHAPWDTRHPGLRSLCRPSIMGSPETTLPPAPMVTEQKKKRSLLFPRQ
ncbi:hypothetical protein CRENBAI_012694 [Crenichthys baileyi]|uniref:Uncharacterized protein n=1 Tax=Crenichthys baileyi TaxID=28760 RepID=A0AAV9R6R4_9TELE